MHPHVVQIAWPTPAANINLLHDWVSQVWMELDPSKVRHICRSFRRRLEAVVMAQGAISTYKVGQSLANIFYLISC